MPPADPAPRDAAVPASKPAQGNAPIGMELLAPAGGWDQLRAAVRFGADAVYLAAERFGMRARATNFQLDDLPAAVAFAHEQGAKVHVACNVLMRDDDIAALPPYLRALQRAGADAVIVGDLGAAALAREHAPDVALHVSTQASVANAAAAKAWHALGAQRIVCAREMSLAEIARLRADTPPSLQIEAFAHGAMCMAVSGRCLISSFLAGRSGNQGSCTQPCRWTYALEEEKRPGQYFPIEEDGRGTLIMNACDLNMLEHLAAMRAAGIDAIKIEGRNKKAFYVASVVAAYRRVLDGEDPAAVAPELYDVSHRPYGTGFYFGQPQQAPDYDGYEQECIHVADVLEAASAPGTAAAGPFALVRCRNRFAEGDRLELLAPHAPARPVAVRDLCWLPDPTDADAAPAPEPVPVANRASALYRFRVDEPLAAGAFLRMRQFRRSSRTAPLGAKCE